MVSEEVPQSRSERVCRSFIFSVQITTTHGAKLEEEHILYNNYMATLPVPNGLPSATDLQPVHYTDSGRGFREHLRAVSCTLSH
jgi:hypothetical protein